MDGVTLSLLTDTLSRQLLATSGDAALLLEDVRFTVLEGPCITAARTGEPVAVHDLRDGLTPWPLFSATVRARLPELGSLYGLPLFFGDYVLGSVDLLAHRAHALGADELEQASAVADAVTAALVLTRDMLLTGRSAPAWEPQHMVRARWFDTVRATGMLAERRREDALAHARRGLPYRLDARRHHSGRPARPGLSGTVPRFGRRIGAVRHDRP
ncbi:GAF domain-containing protein [Streptomyces griseofuscus]|uniref:GAF domain-containing protein n=1 Tax=Streptomyces griseofuscus TaxID=146922 RepID=UPI003454E85D